MCDACESEGRSRPAGIDIELIPAARAIEAGMPGERADDEAWEVFAGRAGGGISWVDYQRLLSSYEAAERAACRGPSLGLRRRNQASFRCDEIRESA
jgi:hypothetical protein